METNNSAFCILCEVTARLATAVRKSAYFATKTNTGGATFTCGRTRTSPVHPTACSLFFIVTWKSDTYKSVIEQVHNLKTRKNKKIQRIITSYLTAKREEKADNLNKFANFEWHWKWTLLLVQQLQRKDRCTVYQVAKKAFYHLIRWGHASAYSFISLETTTFQIHQNKPRKQMACAGEWMQLQGMAF